MGIRVLHISFSLHVLSTRQQLMFVCLCTYVRGGGGGGGGAPDTRILASYTPAMHLYDHRGRPNFPVGWGWG